MPAVNRMGDPLTTGHGCTALSILATPTQSTVRANGILIARQGDFTVTHTIGVPPYCTAHTPWVNLGSLTVRVAGSSVARFGDSVDSGLLTSGSGNVFAG